MLPPQIGFGIGFASTMVEANTKTSTIGGTKIKEKTGKLSKDLGEPAMGASESELQSYIDNASSATEKKKRVARVNLMKAHKKGHKAQGHKINEALIKPSTIGKVVTKPKYR